MNIRTHNRSAWLFGFCCLFLPAMILSCSSTEKKEENAENTLPVETAAHESFRLQRGRLTSTLQIPGELTAFQQVDMYAKVNSYVKKLLVDVGSEVKEGQLLAVLEAPEISSQLAAAESKLKSQEAVYLSSKATYDRLYQTSQTPGTISQNDLDIALSKQNSDKAQLEAAKADYNEIKQTQDYLQIHAPFSGVISMRNVNLGAYVGPSGKGSEMPLFTLQEQKKLRLIIDVPEAYTRFLHQKGQVSFTVRSMPDHQFTAGIARLAGAVGDRLRSERVEMDVDNSNRKLLPGMAAEVLLPLPAIDSTFIVPRSAIVNTTIKPFVIRVIGNKAQWVNVEIGRASDDKEEIYGQLSAGDQLIKIASEEIRNGSEVKISESKK